MINTVKSFNKYETAQTICEEIYEWVSTGFRTGMSVRINGGTYNDLKDWADRHSMYSGLNAAEELIRDGKIFYVHPFKCDNAKCPTRFQYGGFWACNSCNTHIDTPKWWIVKVMKDGNAWVCVGDGFIDLQASDNYAFGLTRDEALENYRMLFVKQ